MQYTYKDTHSQVKNEENKIIMNGTKNSIIICNADFLFTKNIFSLFHRLIRNLLQ
jgi:hypothetical protein